mgnify:CR=1 FL=1
MFEEDDDDPVLKRQAARAQALSRAERAEEELAAAARAGGGGSEAAPSSVASGGGGKADDGDEDEVFVAAVEVGAGSARTRGRGRSRGQLAGGSRGGGRGGGVAAAPAAAAAAAAAASAVPASGDKRRRGAVETVEVDDSDDDGVEFMPVARKPAVVGRKSDLSIDRLVEADPDLRAVFSNAPLPTHAPNKRGRPAPDPTSKVYQELQEKMRQMKSRVAGMEAEVRQARTGDASTFAAPAEPAGGSAAAAASGGGSSSASAGAPLVVTVQFAPALHMAPVRVVVGMASTGRQVADAVAAASKYAVSLKFDGAVVRPTATMASVLAGADMEVGDLDRDGSMPVMVLDGTPGAAAAAAPAPAAAPAGTPLVAAIQFAPSTGLKPVRVPVTTGYTSKDLNTVVVAALAERRAAPPSKPLRFKFDGTVLDATTTLAALLKRTDTDISDLDTDDAGVPILSLDAL